MGMMGCVMGGVERDLGVDDGFDIGRDTFGA
jgi:hypothetical protein